jgi:two-component system, chemotaxis family, protein-glutamate methylesterase/glutaminase
VKREPIRVLVVDDSAHNRREIGELLSGAPDIHIVGTASDGEEGLKKATQLQPDVITLDLEMPRLDGYAFLRLVMASAPTAVIVISSYSHHSDVFKALELGALDFVARPKRRGGEEAALRDELVEKVRAVRLLRPAVRRREGRPGVNPLLIGIGASTGGPPAVQRLLEALSAEPSPVVLIAQHMPEMFTRAFAERLDRIGTFTVTEARDGEVLVPGHAYVAPGGRQLWVQKRKGKLESRVRPPSSAEKHAPSADVLFRSLAEVGGPRALGVVLTGMGADGAAGSLAIHRAGGQVWAESERSAVIFGMPKEAIATGAVARVLSLEELGAALVAEARRRGMGGGR